MKREIISLALNGLDERHVSAAESFSPGTVRDSPERNVPMKKRIVGIALAAALILSLGIAVYAVSGIARWTATHEMPETGEYADLSDLPKVEKLVGFEIIAPERFSSGCSFAGLRVDGEADYDENNEVLRKYYTVNLRYSRTNAPDLLLSVRPDPVTPGTEPPEPTLRRSIRGKEVRLNLDHYKIVPENYTKTAEDLAAESAGHWYISFTDTDRITECDYAFADFGLNGVNYTFMDPQPGPDALATLEDLARELIETAQP